MTQKSKTSKKPSIAVILTIVLVVVFAFVFAIAFILSSTAVDEADTTVTADTYLDEVESALIGADPAIGEQLINDQICVVCHVSGSTTIAPHFTGIAIRAGDRHPPLGAEQYLYEAIVHPMNFVVEDYAPSMPNDYGTKLSQQDIGHIIAYLMTLIEEPDES